MKSRLLSDGLRETLAQFDQGGRPMTTPEVAERLDLGRRSTYDRLSRLVEHGQLETKKVGANARVWWRPPTVADRPLSRLVGDLPGIVYRCRNEPGRPMTFVSEASVEIAGYDPAAIETGEVSWDADVVHPADRRILRDRVAEQLDEGDRFAVEYRIRTADGETRWVREHGHAVVGGDESGGMLEGVITEGASERRPNETERRRERQLRSLVEATTEYAIFMLDPEGRVQTWNEGAARIKGYDADEIVGEHFSTFYTEEERAARVPQRNLAEAERRGATTDEGWRVRADGSTFWANVTITPIYEGGVLAGYAKVTRDMTDRREREQQLRRERDLTDAVLRTIPLGVSVVSTDGELVRANGRAAEILGFTEQAVPADPAEMPTICDADGEPIPPDERPSARVFETGEPVFDWQCQIRHPDGDRRWLSVNVAPLTDEDGRVTHVVATGEDISLLKEQARRLERRRDELEHELAEVFDRVDDAFFALDEEWQFTYVNDRAERLLNRAAGELIGLDIWNAFPEVVGTTFQREYERALDTQTTVSFEEYYPPLETWFEVTAYPSENGLSVYFRDVTDDKERERELERHERIVETVRDGIYVVGEDGRFTQVNDAYASIVGRSREELVGSHVSTVIDDERTLREAQRRERELAAGDRSTVPLKAELPTEGGESVIAEATFSLMNADDGYERIGVVRDVTGREERKRRLEQYERIIETIDDGVYVLDEEFRFVEVNSAYVEMTGYDRDELLGAHCSLVVSEDVSAESFERTKEIAEGGSGSATIEADIRRADGSRLRAESRFTALPFGDGRLHKVGVVRDVSERVKRERELEQYETMFETVRDGIYALDEESRFVAVNDAFCTLVGYDRDELVGAHAETVTDPENVTHGEQLVSEMTSGDRTVATVEETLTTAEGETISIENRVTSYDLGDGRVGRVGAVRDITDRLDRERTLRKRVHQQGVVTELGHRALVDRDLDALLADAARLVADVLDTDYCKVLDLDADAEELLLRQGVGWHDGCVGSATVSAVEDDSQAAYTLRTQGPVVVNDLATETRFSGPDLLTDHGVRSGISTIIGPSTNPWGILGTHDTDPREFSVHDVNFVQSVANIFASAIARHESEQELLRQREQLAALNDLNEVVREITTAVIEQSTRGEIEATVCEHLAESDAYRFAWIGDVDVATQEVRLRTEAGVDGYLDGVALSVDPDDDHGNGPTARAIRTREVQTTRNVRTDPRYAPWRDHAERYGFRSSAAIPIVHDGSIYGVLNVYSERPGGFEGQERAVIAQLGEVIGHAIAAAERKQALMSDEVVELEFQIADVFRSLGVDGVVDGPIRFDHTVQVGADEFILFGRTTAEAVPTVERLVDAIPFYEDVTILGGDDEVRFELHVSKPPVLSAIASMGGSIEEAVIEDGDYRLRVHLSPSADVRQLIDAMTEAYPTATLLKRRQLTERGSDVPRVTRLTSDLTERQRTTLEVAYHAGFFEWPRDTSGEAVAESLGIAPPTFHQHLRKAQRKVFDQVFSGSKATP